MPRGTRFEAAKNNKDYFGHTVRCHTKLKLAVASSLLLRHVVAQWKG